MLESFRPDIKFIAKTASAILAVGVVFAFIFGAVSGNQQLIQAGNTMLTGIVVLAVLVAASWIGYAYFTKRR